MKKLIVHAGFHPEVQREYHGEHIYKVVKSRGGIVGRDYHTGTKLNDEASFYGLDNGAWIKDLGNEKYETDWCSEERWGRVEEQELSESGEVLSSRNLGFVVLRVDRSKGLL
ncbi:MAG: hypothetical protein E7472_01200 [Ruminococcaceae bacterium]|nr:hypothetical protein [Oscillospiraceae bacterium]